MSWCAARSASTIALRAVAALVDGRDACRVGTGMPKLLICAGLTLIA
jgi:hypothetical protein